MELWAAIDFRHLKFEHSAVLCYANYELRIVISESPSYHQDDFQIFDSRKRE